MNDQEKVLEKTEEKALQKANQNSSRRGLEENCSREDLIIPRAKLLQFQSPEVIEDSKTYQPGMIINSLTKEILPANFVPIFRYFEWIRFNPRKKDDPNFDSNVNPGGLIWRSNDPYDPRVMEEGKFGPNGQKPIASKFINFFSYFQGINMPIVVSFANTSFRTGRELNSLIQFSTGDMFSRMYELFSKPEANDLGNYFVFKVKFSALTPSEIFELAEKWFEEFRTRKVETHQEADDSEDQIPF